MTILGVDVGGSGIKGAPVDVDRGIMLTDRFRIPTPAEATPTAVADIVAQIIHEFDWKGPVGCTVPARVQHGLVRTATNIHRYWIDTRVEDLFTEATGLPFHVMNDADAAGVASVAFGAGKGHDGVLLFLTVGTGIGTAMFVDGTLIPNLELGHLPLHGAAAELYMSDRTRKEEELSWADWAGRFQEYLDLVEFLLAPDSIVVGGGVSRPEKVAEFTHLLHTQADLVFAELENEAGIIGAAYAARHLAS